VPHFFQSLVWLRINEPHIEHIGRKFSDGTTKFNIFFSVFKSLVSIVRDHSKNFSLFLSLAHTERYILHL
jgi:hypothetical protein